MEPARALRILLLAIGGRDSPGTRLRVHAYAPWLRERGHSVSLSEPLVRAGRAPRVLFRLLDLGRDLAQAGGFDVVLSYRKTFPGSLARLLRRRARRLILEFDDAIYLPAPAEPQDGASKARYRRNFDATAAAADLAIAGNQELRAALPAALPTEIVPTSVDLSVFRPLPEPRPPKDVCVFGWIGTAENHAEWRRLVPSFRRLLARHREARLKVVSDREPEPCGLPVEFERFRIEREAECLRDFDVGLMPLADTPWNRGKCSVKALQCMALGLPVVVSPVGMNREVVEPGASGLLASHEDEWLQALERLLGSPAERRRMGLAARRRVEERYGLDTIGPRMVEIVERVFEAPRRPGSG